MEKYLFMKIYEVSVITVRICAMCATTSPCPQPQLSIMVALLQVGVAKKMGSSSPQEHSLGLQFHPRLRKLSANCIPSLAPFLRSSDASRDAQEHWGAIPPLSPHLQGQGYRTMITLHQMTFRGEAQWQKEQEDTESSYSWSTAVSRRHSVVSGLVTQSFCPVREEVLRK